MVRSFQKNTNRIFRYFACTASKKIGGGGAPPSGVGWCIRPHFLFFIFFFFSLFLFLLIFFFFIYLLSDLFSFFSYFVVVFQNITVICLCFLVFCLFVSSAIIVQSCRIRFKRIYLRSVAFKLFFDVVGSLMCFYALRSEINEFCSFLVFLFLFSRSFSNDFMILFFLYSNKIINYD